MLHAVTVNFNNSNLTAHFLQSFLTQAPPDARVVVVDNSSCDKEKNELELVLSQIERMFPQKVEVVWSEENVGYFPGLNLGIDLLPKTDPLFVGNNDLLFSPDFFSNFQRILPTIDEAVVAPNISDPDGKSYNPHIALKPTNAKIFYFDVIYSSQFIYRLMPLYQGMKRTFRKATPTANKAHQDQRIWAGFGAGYILMPSFFAQNSKLPEDSFLWGEEVLLTRDVLGSQQKIMYRKDLRLLHIGGASTSKVNLGKRFDLARKTYLINRETMRKINYE